MVSLPLVVFLIQLLCHLVLTIGSKPINDLLWQLAYRLPLKSTKELQEQVRLRREVVRLKREMAGISAQDDFAKWAKVRRQHDKALEAHDKKAAVVANARASFDTIAGGIRWLFTSGLRFALQFWHAKTPLFTYPRGWFPWPIEWFLGFPRCPYGGVSINVWSFACATVITLVADLIVYGMETIQKQRGTQSGTAKVSIPLPAEQTKSQ